MNPISVDDFENGNFEWILNPKYLISSSLNTHNAIHFGDKKNLIMLPPERRKGDTNLW